MEQVGIVEKKYDNKVEVKILRISGCGGNCGSCGGCDAPTNTLILKNNIGAEVGDQVRIRAEARTMLKYTMLIYGIPFVTLLLGVFLSTSILKSRGIVNYENYSFIIGLVTMFIGFILVKRLDSNFVKSGRETVEIIEKI